jgi:dihydropyrimidinase
MPTLDLLIRNGTVVSPEASVVADVAVQGEKIVAVTAPGVIPDAKRVVDAKGSYVIPGGIDPHTHFNMPWGSATMQSWEYGTTAAACGGTTTIIDFAWVVGGTSARDTIEKRLREPEGKASIDYAIHACLMGPIAPATVEEVGQFVKDGVSSIKIYMTYTWAVDDGGLFAAMRAAEKAGGLVEVHAENHYVCEWLKSEYVRRGQNDGRLIAETRPPWVEAEAVRRATTLAQRAGCPLYIVHLSSKEGVQAVYEARNANIPIYGETCPQYLFFTKDDVMNRPDGLRYVNFPPLKTAEDRERLWKDLAAGNLSTVGTDDATYPSADREKLGNTLEQLQAGFSGVEVRLPLLYSEGVAKGKFSINRLVEISSTNAAKIFGLYPRKGAIAVGSDADIVVLDPKAKRTITLSELHGWTDYTVYEGWELQGFPVLTVSRGRVVSEEGRFVGQKGHGQFIPREAGSAFRADIH